MKIADIFENNGGRFLTSAANITTKINKIKTFVFDWDGVFNQGYKGNEYYSPFSEADSMGVNMLRFGFWLKNGIMPVTGIITGMNNPNARFFADREHLDFVIEGAKNKIEAINKICNDYGLMPENIAFVFDDILDISAAKICGLRFMVKHTNRPLFADFVTNNVFADYITFSTPRTQAVREISELILGLAGIFEKTLNNRIEYTENYKKYVSIKTKIQPKIKIYKP